MQLSEEVRTEGEEEQGAHPGGARDEYAFSRRMYTVECALQYLITILASGVYLAKLTTTIGISDGMTAILSAISSLAGIFQVISIPLSHRRSAKRTVIPFLALHQLLYAFLYVIPFLGLSSAANSAVFFVCIFASVILSEIAAPLKLNWFFSLTSSEGRGSLGAIATICMHVSGLVFSFAASMLVDKLDAKGNTEGVFAVFSVTILLLSVMHFITLALSREKKSAAVSHASAFGDVAGILKNRRFRLYLYVCVLHNVGIFISQPFFGTYKLRELGLSMMQSYALDAINAVAAVFFLAFFGNFARKRSILKAVGIGYPILAVSFLFVFAAFPACGFWAFALFHIVNTLGSAGVTVGLDALVFDIVPGDRCATALSIRNMIMGPAAFISTTVMSRVLTLIQDNGNTVLGFHLYAQQFFGLLSFAAVFVASLLFRRFSKTACGKNMS